MSDEELEQEFLKYWIETESTRNGDEDFTDSEALWKIARRFGEDEF